MFKRQSPTQRKQGLLEYNKYNLPDIQQNSSAGIFRKTNMSKAMNQMS